MTDTPTSEADSQSLQQLFSKDPEELTDEEVDKIADHYRSKRKIFMTEEMQKKAKGTGGKGTKEAPSNLSLDYLLV